MGSDENCATNAIVFWSFCKPAIIIEPRVNTLRRRTALAALGGSLLASCSGRRIDAIVERLDGYISRNSEDGAFTTEILLPQE